MSVLGKMTSLVEAVFRQQFYKARREIKAKIDSRLKHESADDMVERSDDSDQQSLNDRLKNRRGGSALKNVFVYCAISLLLTSLRG
jgi:hypothetical protein